MKQEHLSLYRIDMRYNKIADEKESPGLKSIINVDGDKLRQLKVGGKFSYTFKRIYTFLCVALVLLVASIAIGIFSYSNLYKNYYNQNTY